MIETTASKRFAEERRHRSHGAEPALSAQKHSPSGMRQNASTERGGYSVFTWLNLVCLDAPLVAISWEWLFARSFDIPVAPGGTAALFVTAWLIYVADRFGDSVSLDLGVPTSLRQRFC